MPEIRRMGYILTAVLAVALLVAFAWKPERSAKFEGLTSSQIPTTIGDSAGVEVPVDSATRAALPSADIVGRRYTLADGSTIDVTIIGGTGRNELHDPRSCLVGAGWVIQNDRVEKLPGTSNVAVRACEIAQTGSPDDPAILHQNAEDMLYLYVIGNKTIASASDIRWSLLKSDLLEQNDVPVYFIRTISSLPSSNRQSEANRFEHQQLLTFTSALWHAVAPVVDPGGDK